MTADEKITKWIHEQEDAGRTRDEIARGVFVSKNADGTFNVYRLAKSGKTKYNLNVHLSAVDLATIEEA